MNMNIRTLDNVAVDMKQLSTNFGDIAYDCYGMDGATLKTELQNRFPVVMWLLGTRLSRTVISGASRNMMGLHKNEDGEWVLEVPRTIWTTLPASTENECCWLPFDFAKCAGNVPLKLLCLKDCENILDGFVSEIIKPGRIEGISSAGESLASVKRRIARLSMAFLTAQNVMLGVDNAATTVLKPFHGLLQVMENPAVTSIDGTNILAAFDELGCRMDVIGGFEDTVIAVNPIIYSSIEAEVRPGQNGELPAGWARRGDRLYFKGIAFIEDRLVPVDTANGTGDAWILNGDAIGAYLATDLAPTDRFIREAGTEETQANGCRTECTYYYNFGAVFNNNANKLAVISDIPVSTACAGTLGSLGGLIVPKTLIPEA